MLVLLVAFPDVTALGLASALGQTLCADTIHEATRLAHAHRPNLALVHASCAGRAALLAELVPTLFFGDEQPPGEYNFIPANVSLGDLKTAVCAVAAGERPLLPELPNITPAESRVLRLIADGKSNRAIALELGLRIGTVKNRVSSLLYKAQQDTRTQLALWAREWRLG